MAAGSLCVTAVARTASVHGSEPPFQMCGNMTAGTRVRAPFPADAWDASIQGLPARIS
jgi:hypothetical protein